MNCIYRPIYTVLIPFNEFRLHFALTAKTKSGWENLISIRMY
jgi:hypothetical protein